MDKFYLFQAKLTCLKMNRINKESKMMEKRLCVLNLTAFRRVKLNTRIAISTTSGMKDNKLAYCMFNRIYLLILLTSIKKAHWLSEKNSCHFDDVRMVSSI